MNPLIQGIIGASAVLIVAAVSFIIGCFVGAAKMQERIEEWMGSHLCYKGGE